MLKLVNAVDRVLMVAVSTLTAILVVVIAADVVGRYGFGRSLLFANELSRMCFIWVTFLVMPLGISQGMHVAITTLPNMLAQPAQRLLYRAGVVAVIVLMCVVFLGSIVSIRARSLESLNTLPLSAAWYFYPLAIGSAWSMVHLVVRFLEGKPAHRRDGTTEHARS